MTFRCDDCREFWSGNPATELTVRGRHGMDSSGAFVYIDQAAGASDRDPKRPQMDGFKVRSDVISPRNIELCANCLIGRHNALLKRVAGDFPEVICLCGSTKFKSAYRQENQRLSLEGNIVISVGLFGHADDIEFTDTQKEQLDDVHKRKIDMADRVHVINVDGYIGDSTRSEIEYAKERGKEVTYYE